VQRDRRILERCFPAAARFVDELRATNPDLIRRKTVHDFEGYGDWLAFDDSNKTEGGTPKELIGTAYFAHSARLVAAMAEVLGKKSEAKTYSVLAERCARRSSNVFSPRRRPDAPTQTAASWRCTSTGARQATGPRRHRSRQRH